ncbi:hypothetical protein C8R47DRAFT_915262, partial [Mycena vitilis]
LREAASPFDPSKPESFRATLEHKMDKAYPYREMAPSRRRTLQSTGPFTEARVRTDAGLLSAIIFRAITFGTEFLFDYRTYFKDINDFHAVEEEAAAAYRLAHGADPPKAYFCLVDAYGVPNVGRKVTLADGFAAALENDSWAAKFKNRNQIPFVECYAWLSGALPQTGQGAGKKKKVQRFHGLGQLGAYLLTADLVYAGAVVSPTVEEMGEMVWRLNKGATGGLERLGLIPKRVKLVSSKQRPKESSGVKTAFIYLFKKVVENLPADLLTRCGFDYIVLEHSLCKFGR